MMWLLWLACAAPTAIGDRPVGDVLRGLSAAEVREHRAWVERWARVGEAPWGRGGGALAAYDTLPDAEAIPLLVAHVRGPRGADAVQRLLGRGPAGCAALEATWREGGPGNFGLALDLATRGCRDALGATAGGQAALRRWGAE